MTSMCGKCCKTLQKAVGCFQEYWRKKQWESCEQSTSVGTTHLLSVCGAVAVLDEVASPPKCLGDGWAASLLLPLFSLASLHTSVRFFALSHGVPASHRLPHFTWSTRKLPLNMLKLLSSTRTFLSFRGHIWGSHYTTHSGDHFKVSYLSCLPISSQVFNQVCLAQAFFDAWTDWHCQLARFAVTAQPSQFHGMIAATSMFSNMIDMFKMIEHGREASFAAQHTHAIICGCLRVEQE